VSSVWTWASTGVCPADRDHPRTDPPSCCSCDPSHAHCVRGTRRRTAEAYYPEPGPAVIRDFNWFYLQASVACAASVALFAVIFAGLQCRGRRRHTPVLELSDSEEHLALTDYQNDDNMDDLDDAEEHLVVFERRT